MKLLRNSQYYETRYYCIFKQILIYYFSKHNKSFNNVIIEKVSHPSSPWWTRDNGKHGRQKFENLLREYWVKSK